jgi:Cu(I)/Ag(I) efflux system membrane fusion protein
MKKSILIGIVCVAVGLGAGWFMFHPVGGGSTPAGRQVLYYRDPMNPQNTSPTPKKAPDGMDFVPVYAEGSGGSGEQKVAYYQDPMHPWYTSDTPGKAPDCGMNLVPVYEGEADAKGIKIDPATVQNIGVKVEEVRVRKLNNLIRTLGKVGYDERKVYSINTKIMGWIEKLNVDYTGQLVRKGEPLLELYSPELVSTQEEYLQALRYEHQMAASTSEEARKGSESLVQSARRRLLYWDIPESEISALEQRGTPKKTMTVYSPVDGYVIEKMAYKGQNVMAGMELYKIADLSTVWVLADIYQYELPWVKTGQRAEIELSYTPGKKFRGTVTYVYPTLNMDTKTAKVRIELHNTPTLEFKPEMFATVQITSPVAVNTVAVPEQAIIRSGERDVAVIALAGGYFDPREVTLGVTAGGYVQILDGMKEGEKIVVSSQFLIDSESNLKAAISQMSDHTAREGSMSMDDSTGAAKRHEAHDMNAMQPSNGAPAMKEKDSGHNNETVQSMIDPVCGMETDGDEGLSAVYNGKKYYFCSRFDMEKFKADPTAYAK